MVGMAGLPLHVVSHAETPQKGWSQDSKSVRVEAAECLEVLAGRFTMSHSASQKETTSDLKGWQKTPYLLIKELQRIRGHFNSFSKN